ncbi:MAG: N-acetylmuramoyl-L-alanine amidase [Lachnospiraceae bacterium]
MSKTIIIDPGHGGFDPGAVYENRKEKDDNLRLALAVGQELQNAGYQIIYTRTDDRYDSPYDKAQIANSAGGDLFLSFHRNFAETPDLYQGVQALVYDKNPLALRVAKNVNEELESIGFKNLGIESRKELVVLRRTSMPAVLLEVSFINSAEDNRLFDEKFDAIANAIATGVERALPLIKSKETSASSMPPDNTIASIPMQQKDATASMSMQQKDATASMFMQQKDATASMSMQPDDTMESMRTSQNSDANPLASMRRCLTNHPCDLDPLPKPDDTPRFLYYVQVGLFRYPENAVYLMQQLNAQGYSTVWKRIGGLIAIWVGPVDSLDEAVRLQRKLQNDGYETLIVTDDYIARK